MTINKIMLNYSTITVYSEIYYAKEMPKEDQTTDLAYKGCLGIGNNQTRYDLVDHYNNSN